MSSAMMQHVGRRILLSFVVLPIILSSYSSLSSSSLSSSVEALQNLFPPKIEFPNFRSLSSIAKAPTKSTPPSQIVALEDELLRTIDDLGGDENRRLLNSERIDALVQQLEQTAAAATNTKNGIISRPAIDPTIYGRWRLLQTTNAGTASPIQRKAVDSSKFPIYQNIFVVDDDKEDNDNNNNNNKPTLIVRQSVVFNKSKKWVLNVDALASTSVYPLQELTERKGDGKILGMNLLGVSKVGEEALADDSRPDSRIDFVFDEGFFEFGDTIKIPYPVPFRLPILRDAVKGWIDITYLSNRLRISKGNKGTTFILLKEEDDDEEEDKGSNER